jgi:hypothetical protein
MIRVVILSGDREATILAPPGRYHVGDHTPPMQLRDRHGNLHTVPAGVVVEVG